MVLSLTYYEEEDTADPAAVGGSGSAFGTVMEPCEMSALATMSAPYDRGTRGVRRCEIWARRGESCARVASA